MSSINISGTVTDTAGVTGGFNITAFLGSTLIVGATVTPINSDTPVTRNVVVSPTGGTPPYTFSTPISSGGQTMTPVAGKPGQWTFVF
jgi:hypothetical protein